MKYFFDTEFIEDGHTVDLMSIGIVAEDGRTLYLESSECDLSKAGDWVQANVIPHLHGPKVSRAEMLRAIVTFIGGDMKPQFWAYFPTYDWICLCQLWGTMMDLPGHWPKFPRDLKFLATLLGIHEDLDKRVPQVGTQHDALEDALWNLKAFKYLRHVAMSQVGGSAATPLLQIEEW